MEGSMTTEHTITMAGTIQLPKTGQTTSYYSGDDGAIQAGVAWPIPRFTDHGDSTVTDNLTGLMWTKDANPAGNSKMTWQQALDYVKTLNTGGHTDWRLPNVNELHSLVDHSQFRPPLPLGHPFNNVQTNRYWSSTTYAARTDDAWIIVIMYNGIVEEGNKSYDCYVWPVRG